MTLRNKSTQLYYWILRSRSPFKVITKQVIEEQYYSHLINPYRVKLLSLGQCSKVMAGDSEVIIRNSRRLFAPPLKNSWIRLGGLHNPYEFTFIESNHEILELEKELHDYN